jgi:pilus assembly protein Flp/PilA
MGSTSRRRVARHLLHNLHTGFWLENQTLEKMKMNDLMLKMYVNLQTLMMREEGQDLVEYALVVALIAFGATVAMKALATEINVAFNTISGDLSSAL